jgi:hypothetical protein
MYNIILYISALESFFQIIFDKNVKFTKKVNLMNPSPIIMLSPQSLNISIKIFGRWGKVVAKNDSLYRELIMLVRH